MRHPDLGVVGAVIVTYHIGAVYRGAFEAIRAQVDFAVVVDNGSGAETVTLLRALHETDPEHITLILNERNQGLGKAQNQGIAHALENGADWVLLLDHDSTADAHMLDAMARAYRRLADRPRVAVLAPRLRHDAIDMETPYLPADHRWQCRRRLLRGPVLSPVLFVIASGSLIRADALRRVGLMREDFFIDYLDVELGLRLSNHGLHIAVVRDAILNHRVGDTAQHRFAGRGFKTTNHSAARRYTIFRNRAWLWRRQGRNWPGWLLFDVGAALADVWRIVMFETGKQAKLGAILRGLHHGLGDHLDARPDFVPTLDG